MKKIMEKRDLEKNMKRQKREKPYRDRRRNKKEKSKKINLEISLLIVFTFYFVKNLSSLRNLFLFSIIKYFLDQMQKRKEILIVHLICIGLGSQKRKKRRSDFNK